MNAMYRVYMISTLADFDVRATVPAGTAAEARERAVMLMARPSVWLVVSTKRVPNKK